MEPKFLIHNRIFNGCFNDTEYLLHKHMTLSLWDEVYYRFAVAARDSELINIIDRIIFHVRNHIAINNRSEDVT